jgi:Uma2 family endonuclease
VNWQEVCEHPSLQNLPFKIELNEYGHILMSPVKIYHSAFQGEIIYLLRSLLKTGKTLPECAITTEKGVKVADVAWLSLERFKRVKQEVACSVAPEICIEVISLSNSDKELTEKRSLYFQQGAQECWTCNEMGCMVFYNETGQLIQSLLVPNFPKQIIL